MAAEYAGLLKQGTLNMGVYTNINITQLEMVSSEILRKEETEKTIKNHNFEVSNSKLVDNENAKETVFITRPPSKMHENTSDDLIPVSELLNPSNGDSSSNTLLPFNTGNTRVSLGCDGSYGAATSHQVMSSSILLESKQSQHQISIPSNVEFCKENTLRENCIIVMDKANMLQTNEKNQHEKNKLNEVDNVNCQDNETEVVAESPPSIAVQSIFSDIFQDIEEIKGVINSYMSSFYVQEEEYNNFPKLHTSPQVVASHFFEQIHGPLKDKNCNPKNMHSTFCHSFKENACNDCFPEQCYLENDTSITVSAVDMKAQNRHTLQENTNKIEAGKETSSCYCYWEDNDLEGEFTNGKLAENIESSSNPERNCNKELVTLEFIENMWEEFTKQVETHALFVDLVNENELRKFEPERHFPSYGHWASMYDPNIFQEAENIVYTLDSLLMDGCFPTDESNNAAYIPCTIVELVDESEFSPGFEDGPSENRDKPSNRDGNISTEQECLAFPHETDSAANVKNQNFMLNDPLAKEINNRQKIHEIKLEPVFYQEKVVLHEIDYSRVPEYEKIQLDPINHEGRVDFSTLQSYDSNFDSSTVEVKKYDTEEQIKKHIIPKENLSQKYVNEEIITNKERFFEDNSKSQLTLEKNDDMEPLMDKLDENNSDTRASMFEKIQERNNPGNSNPAFLFSSPTVPLNLTNPFVDDTNKK